MEVTRARPAREQQRTKLMGRSRRCRGALGAVLVVAMGAVAACSASDVTVSEATRPGSSGTTDAESATAETSADVTSVPASSVAPPTTVPPTTAPPSTTLPPRPVVSAQTGVLQNSVERGLPNRPTDALVVPGATVARMSINAVVDGRWAARIDTIGDDKIVNSVPLTVDGAVEVLVYDLAATETVVVALGSMIAVDGTRHGVLWRSIDGGETFAPGEVIPGLLQMTADVGLLDDGTTVVVGWVVEPRPSKFAAARRDPDGNWTDTIIADSADTYSPTGVVGVGQTVVITGSNDQGVAGSVGTVWVSTDAATTFQTITTGLESVGSIGSPIWTGAEYVAMGEGRGNDPSKMLRSPDGVTWTPVDLSLTRNGEPIAAVRRDAGPMVVFGDQLAVSFSSLLSQIAIIDRDGRGTVAEAASIDNRTSNLNVYFDAIPYVIDSTLHIVARSYGGYVLAVERSGEWSLGDGDPTTAMASGSRVSSLRDTVVAESSVYPLVERVGKGLIWRGEQTWNVVQDGSWVQADAAVIPSKGGTLATNGTTDLLLESDIEDPVDDFTRGPLGGTSARLRSVVDGTWSEPELVATGPGSDYLGAATGYGPDAFLTAGSRTVNLDDGGLVKSPLLYRYVDGTWTEEAVPEGVPPLSWMGFLAASLDHDVLAVGSSSAEGWDGPLLLTRNDDAVWSIVEAPFTGEDVDIFNVRATDTTVELLVREDADWFLYTFDAGAFVRTAIIFDGAAIVTPLDLVTLDGQRYLVGTSSGVLAGHLVIWQLNDDHATELEWSQPITGLDLTVSNATVSNGSIFVAGQMHGENVVWQLTIDMIAP